MASVAKKLSYDYLEMVFKELRSIHETSVGIFTLFSSSLITKRVLLNISVENWYLTYVSMNLLAYGLCR